MIPPYNGYTARRSSPWSTIPFHFLSHTWPTPTSSTLRDYSTTGAATSDSTIDATLVPPGFQSDRIGQRLKSDPAQAKNDVLEKVEDPFWRSRAKMAELKPPESKLESASHAILRAITVTELVQAMQRRQAVYETEILPVWRRHIYSWVAGVSFDQVNFRNSGRNRFNRLISGVLKKPELRERLPLERQGAGIEEYTQRPAASEELIARDEEDDMTLGMSSADALEIIAQLKLDRQKSLPRAQSIQAAPSIQLVQESKTSKASPKSNIAGLIESFNRVDMAKKQQQISSYTSMPLPQTEERQSSSTTSQPVENKVAEPDSQITELKYPARLTPLRAGNAGEFDIVTTFSSPSETSVSTSTPKSFLTKTRRTIYGKTLNFSPKLPEGSRRGVTDPAIKEAVNQAKSETIFRKLPADEMMAERAALSAPSISSPSEPCQQSPHLTHLNASNEAHMVDVGSKASTHRIAIASGRVVFGEPGTYDLVKSASLKKGDVLSVARVAGIMSAKNCPMLIPLCHPIALTSIDVDVRLQLPSGDPPLGSILVYVKVECIGPTGVEMEALTGTAGACLTVFDMIKGVDRGALIERNRVVFKAGGRSGDWGHRKIISDALEIFKLKDKWKTVSGEGRLLQMKRIS